MAFREHLDEAVYFTTVDPVSEMRELCLAHPGKTIVFSQVEGAPGHRAAMNICMRHNLAANFDIPESEVIDVLGWTMDNRGEPVSVVGAAAILENSITPVDLSQLPIPLRWPEQRCR